MHGAPNPQATVAYRWVDILLEAAAREVDHVGARPTIISRAMAITVTAMYDAWAAYDATAVGTRLGGALRRPAAERTAANKAKALSYAAYRTLVDLYPGDVPWLSAQMRGMGYDAGDASTDRATPQGIGNVTAAAVLAYRHHDGANQLGDEAGSTGAPYSDYTFYQPVNSVGRVVDIDRWQPIPFEDGKGGTVVMGFLTPHWYRVKPFALDRSDQFRPPPPPRAVSAELRAQVDECLKYNANLTLPQKALVEFMRDGPRSTGQSGHWLRFAQDLSRRDHYALDQDVKLFFCVGNVVFDAFIACWESKRQYDTSRPWTLVRYYYKGSQVEGWGGPGKGVVRLPADQWHPYSPFTFVTPPFPGYVSGHSTASGSAARMLALFSGSDRFDVAVVLHPGSLTEAGFPTDVIQARDGVRSAALPSEVTLTFPTLWYTAEQAGISRIMGGYHIQADNIQGLALGRKVADATWPRCQALFNGTARVRD